MTDTWLTPVQVNERLKQIYKTIYKTTWEPIDVNERDKITYFNNPQTYEKKKQYDLYFSFSRPSPLYDQRKLKENRQFLPDIRENIYNQELKKAVPALTSLNYGKRKFYDPSDAKFNLVDQVSTFYRRNGAFPVKEKPVASSTYVKCLNL